MKKILILLIFASGVLSAQILRMGPNVGFSNPNNTGVKDLSLPEFDSDIHYGISGKLNIPMVPFAVYASYTYTKFSTEGQVNIIDVLTNHSAESKLNQFTLGAQFYLLPAVVKPYLTGEYLLSNFDSSSSLFNLSFNKKKTYSGLGIGAGVEFTLLPKFDVDLSLKYKFNKLFGKDDNEDNFNTLNLSLTVLFGVL